MKKEAVSTFNEGLNYDLNPITTPNNVLTDCVNGTFLTANGDELALQNDSGNATIRVNFSDASEYKIGLDKPESPIQYNYGSRVFIKTLTGKDYFVNINSNRIVNPEFVRSNLQTIDNWLLNNVNILTTEPKPEDIKTGIFLSVSQVTGTLKQTLELKAGTEYDIMFTLGLKAIEQFSILITYLNKDFQTIKVDTQTSSNPTFNVSYDYNKKVVIKTPIDTKYTQISFIARSTSIGLDDNYFFVGDLKLIAKPTNISNTEVWQNVSEVSLSDGFKPIAMKEYGGILYIVSGKKDINGDKIEFGSYPCLENLRESIFITNEPFQYNISNLSLSNLLSSQVINETKFTAGKYVIFNGTSDTSNISYPKYKDNTRIGNTYKIYKIRLIQQLNNGFIDLTDDIWDKYARFIFTKNKINLNYSDEIKFWFNDPEFKYYCPNNFQGRLALITELEPLKTFKLDSYNLVIGPDKYTYQFRLLLENESKLPISHIRFNYWLDGVEQPPQQFPVNNGFSGFEVNFPDTYSNRVFDYFITPMFFFDNTNLLINSSFKYLDSSNMPINWGKWAQDINAVRFTLNNNELTIFSSLSTFGGLYYPWNFNINKNYILSFKVKTSTTTLIQYGTDSNTQTSSIVPGEWVTKTLQLNIAKDGIKSNNIVIYTKDGSITVKDIKLEYLSTETNSSTEWCLGEGDKQYFDNELPLTYLNNYLIRGSDLISTQYGSIKWLGEDAVCEKDDNGEYTGYKYFTKLTLVNDNNAHIDNLLNLSGDKKYSLYLDQEQASTQLYSLGIFEIDTRETNVRWIIPNTLLPISKFNLAQDTALQTPVRFLSEICIRPILKIKPSLALSTDSRVSSDFVTIMQDDIITEIVLPNERGIVSFTTPKIEANKEFTITINRELEDRSLFTYTGVGIVNNSKLKLIQELNFAMVESISRNKNKIFLNNTLLGPNLQLLLNMEYSTDGLTYQSFTWEYNDNYKIYEFTPAVGQISKVRLLESSPWYKELPETIDYFNINTDDKDKYRMLELAGQTYIFKTEYTL